MAAAAVYAGWIFLGRYLSGGHWGDRRHDTQPARTAEFESAYGGTAVKILQFYARDGSLTEGGTSVICYGVLNARSVRIDPPVESVSVSPNRCVEVAPERDTRYTLTAEGSDGHAVSESFVLKVKPDLAALPGITSFRIESHTPDYRGRQVFLITFSARNPNEVKIDPPVFPTLHGAPNGRFYVAPEKTTTYTLTVTGKRGHKAQQQLTVKVPPG
ncbi:MAG: hypothetical protein LAQ69_37720 [Acidobacteriia bacterium]|nr:hypothetical protein [Terriglobia bacterium]